MSFDSLYYALIDNSIEIVTEILDNKDNAHLFPGELNILKGNYPRYAPLHLAALFCPRALVPLIEKGADVNLQNLDGDTPFFEAVNRQPIEVLELLIKNGALSNAVDNEGGNALFRALLNPDPGIIVYLIAFQKLDPNRSDNNGATPLTGALKAIKYNKFLEERVFVLREFGANPNLPSTNLNIVLEQAYNLTGFLKDYISYDAPSVTPYEVDVNYITDKRQYPLATAIFKYNKTEKNYGAIRAELNYEIIRYLTQKGAKITQSHKDLILRESNDAALIKLIQNAPTF